jgi:hypothetical protein
MGRFASKLVTSIALMCATLAWICFVYLNTVADVHRVESIATAVLDDDEARGEIAASISGQIVRAAGIGPSQAPLVEGAVADAIEDPRISDNLITAFGASHANALGVDDSRSTTIDTASLVSAVRERLFVIEPGLAELLPDSVIEQVTLPSYQPPGVGAARRAAQAASAMLALVALLLLVTAFVLGDRRSVLRRFGVWALLCAGFWILMPLIVAALAKAFASDVDAIISTAVRASVDGIAPAAAMLAVAGAAAIVVSMIPSWWPDQRVNTRGFDDVRQPRHEYAYATPTARPSRETFVPTQTVPAAARVDTFVRSPIESSAYIQAADATPVAAPPPVARPMPAAQPEPEDPWTHYFGTSAGGRS